VVVWPGSTCSTALLLTYNSPATHTHTPSTRSRAHTFRLELTASTVNDVRPACRETTDFRGSVKEPVSHADTVSTPVSH